MSFGSKIATIAATFALIVLGVGVVSMPTYAETSESGGTPPSVTTGDSWQEGLDAAKADGVPENVDGNDGVVKKIINGVLYVVGILAVVMVIIGGVQYTTSGGDQAAVTKAKNTILYGIVGLVIAILAYAIVNFVMTKVTS